MWRMKQIFDGEYGCEERPDGEKARCVVTLENELGEKRELSVYDDWLKEKHLEEESEWTAELFDICNEEGQPIGGIVERSHAHAEGICHRTVHVWVVRMVDGKYQVLLQKRTENKESFPGCFDTSSAGHIQAGDEPLESAIRELEEELGIHASPEQLNYAGKFHIHYEMEFHGHPFKDNETSFVFCYQEPIDIAKLTLQKEEVEAVEWFDLEEVHEACLTRNPKFCVPIEGLQTLMKYLNRQYPVKRCSQPFGEKFNDHTGAERRNDGSLSGSYDFELEEYKGQKNGNYHAGNIKNNFHIGKAYMGSVGDGFYKGFPGIEDDIGNGGGR